MEIFTPGITLLIQTTSVSSAGRYMPVPGTSGSSVRHSDPVPGTSGSSVRHSYPVPGTSGRLSSVRPLPQNPGYGYGMFCNRPEFLEVMYTRATIPGNSGSSVRLPYPYPEVLEVM